MHMKSVFGAVILAAVSGFAAEPSAKIPVLRTVPHELDVLIKSGHIQGAACSEEGIYLSHQLGIDMVGWDGKHIRRVEVPAHLGDIAYADGKIYGAFVLRGKERGNLPGMVKVWNAKLEPLKEKRFVEPLDGIVVLNGTVYAGIDRWGRDRHPLCCVKRLDLDLNDLGNTDVDLGYEIHYGVQTMATDGKDLFFGNYGGTSRVSADLKSNSTVSLACSEGFGLVPKSVSKRETPVFFTVKALGGNMKGWRKDPTNNPPRIEIRFHEYKDGAFSDITERAVAIGDISVEASGVEDLARQELVRHLELLGGTPLGTNGSFRLVLGEKAPGAGEVAPFTSYGKRVGNAIHLWGDDSEKRHGTLFAVYGFLETVCGIRWAYPGDDGIVFRPQASLAVPADWSWTYRPPLMKSEMRGAGRGKFDEEGFLRWQKYLPNTMRGNDASARRETVDNFIWDLRMRHQTRENYSFGHAFGKWNERFRETHPEYLAMNADGTRGIRKGNPKYGKLCVSNEAVVDQIVADWVRGGKEKYLNVCPNDSKGYCRCEKCCALDCPLSDDEPFDLHKTDRYVNFWNRLAKKLVAIRPDVVVCTYIYESYREPPRRERLEYGENMLFGVVLRQDDDNDACIEGWRKAGMKRFLLRPNSLCYHGILPRGFEKYFYDNIRTAVRNGMIGCDYDGSFRRVMDFESYVIARAIADPTLSFGTIEREFLSQYGAAAPVMKEYYDRIRARGEVARIARQNLPAAEKEVAGDDSQLYKGMLEANPVAELERDLEVLRRAAAVSGLSAVERRRVEMRLLMGEHALKTGVFLHARDTRPAKEFARLGLDLLKYRAGICRRISEQWGRLFRAYRCEVHWWRRMRRELKAVYPEMELDD